MKTALIAGGTGLVGQRLISHLRGKYHIKMLTRGKTRVENEVRYYQWDLDKMTMDEDAVDTDVVINLNGAGIADGRWTNYRKQILTESRVLSNQLLAESFAKSGNRMEALCSASAIGYYGDRGSEPLNENSAKGVGFMADLCEQWEASAQSLASHANSSAILRIGVVLSTKDGALPKMLMTQPMGVLSYFGNGGQYYSWIHIDDLCRLMARCLEDLSYQGVINACAPHSMPNKQFIQEVKKGVGSGAIVLPAPAFGLRLAMGEMADVILNSNNVVPQKLKDVGFDYLYPQLSQAVKHLVDNKI